MRYNVDISVHDNINIFWICQQRNTNGIRSVTFCCKGGVDWLKGQSSDDEDIDTYSEFVKNVDTILMGWNTYHQVVTKLSPTEWIYNDFTTYPIDLIKSLKKKTEKVFERTVSYGNGRPLIGKYGPNS